MSIFGIRNYFLGDKGTRAIKRIMKDSEHFSLVMQANRVYNKKLELLGRTDRRDLTAADDLKKEIKKQQKKLDRLKRLSRRGVKFSIELKQLLAARDLEIKALRDGQQLAYDALRGKLQRRILDQEALGIYKQMFEYTLKAEQIAQKSFADQQEDLRLSEIDSNILEHLKTNLEKQMQTLEEIQNNWDEALARLKKLVEEEEHFYSILFHNRKAEEGLLKVIEADLGKISEEELKNPAFKWALFRLIIRGSIVALVLWVIWFRLLRAPPEGHSRPEIMAEVRRVLNQDVDKLIGNLPPKERERIKKEAEKQLSESAWQRYLKPFEQVKKEYAQEILKMFKEEYSKQAQQVKKELEAQGVSASDQDLALKYSDNEILQAIYNTLDMYKIDIMNELKDFKFSDNKLLDWAMRGGGSPQFTGKAEQSIRLKIKDVMDPKVDALKREIKERIKALFWSQIVERIIPGTKAETKPKDNLLLFVLGGVLVVNFIINRIPLVGWAKKKLTRVLVKGTIPDLIIVIRTIIGKPKKKRR